MRGQWHHAQHTEADNERSRQLFQRAIAIDANFSAPYLGLARSYLEDAVACGTRSVEDAAELSVTSARKAVAIDPEDADARAMVAMAAMHSGNADEAHEQVWWRGLQYKLAVSILIEAHLLLHAGKPAQARQGLTAYLRIDPRGPHRYLAMHLFAISYYFERDYTRSVEASRRALARIRPFSGLTRWLAARWVSWVERKRRRQRCKRCSNFRLANSNSTPVAGRHGTGQRTTNTCSMVCARRDGRADRLELRASGARRRGRATST